MMKRAITFLCLLSAQLSAQVSLSASDVRAGLATPAAPVVSLKFVADPAAGGGDLFDVVCSDTSAVVTLTTPGSVEITASNAESQGVDFSVFTRAPGGSEMLSGLLGMTGTHTLIRLGAGMLPGEYTVKADAGASKGDVIVFASYASSSSLRAGLAVGKRIYRVGAPVALNGVIFDAEKPVTGASVKITVLDEASIATSAPTPVEMLGESASRQAAGEGAYLGIWRPEKPGRYNVAMQASGVSPSGVAFSRTASASVLISPPMGRVVSLRDEAVDLDGDGRIDQVTVAARVAVETPGKYRFAVKLVSPSGVVVNAREMATLDAGQQEIAAVIPSAAIASLGEDGPYQRKDALLLFEGEKEALAADTQLDAGVSEPYRFADFLPGAPALLKPDRQFLSFGPVVVNGARELTLNVVNSSPAPFTERKVTLSDRTFSLVSPSIPFTVAAGAVQPVVIRFAPSSRGSRNGALSIGGSSISLTGAGADAAPVIAVAPSILDFGTVAAGQSKDLTLTIRNTGTATLNLTAITSDKALFRVTAPVVPVAIAPGAQQTVTIRFSPTAAGTQTATLTIRGNDPASSTVTVLLSGKT